MSFTICSVAHASSRVYHCQVALLSPVVCLVLDFWLLFLFSCLLQKWTLALWNDSARPVSCPATFALFKALCPPALTLKASTFDPKIYLGDVMLPGMLPLWSDALKENLIWKHFEIQEGETCGMSGITETSVLHPSATSSSSILLGRRLKLMSASFAK